jgi:hypothetical protein
MASDLVKSDERKDDLVGLPISAWILCDKSRAGSEVAGGVSVPSRDTRQAIMRKQRNS